MNEQQRRTLMEIRRALDAFVVKIADVPAEINDSMVAIRPWRPGTYKTGDVRMHDGTPYKCVQGHDSADNPDWTPDATPSLWMQYHGTTRETARPWIAPTGAQDMYRNGEYMIFTDGKVYRCKEDSSYSPVDYPKAWELVQP